MTVHQIFIDNNNRKIMIDPRISRMRNVRTGYICVTLLFFSTFFWLHLQWSTFNRNFRQYPVLQRSNNEVEEIRKQIERVNKEQRILNDNSFEPLTSDAPIILVQVHNRAIYLKHLIDSLSKAYDIKKALLIFSHDIWDPEINDLVQNIKFCRVMQIFYPHSIQTHPHSFPGDSPNDCPRDIGKQQALKLGCLNAKYPDTYGHYREAKFTQTKHHWWWKANRVFGYLNVTRNHTGMVIFLEEDHYVVEDFLYVLRIMDQFRRSSKERYDVIVLGNYDTPLADSYDKNGDKVKVAPWVSNEHNMGMALNRETWNKISKCAETFCTYDDYNWDWSIQYISYTCFKSDSQSEPGSQSSTGMMVLQTAAPRIIHNGKCGMHHVVTNCNVASEVMELQKELSSAHSYLYPRNISSVTKYSPENGGLPKKSGGWADVRDHELCLQNSFAPATSSPGKNSAAGTSPMNA